MHIDIQEELCSGCRLCSQVCAITHFKEINPKKSAIIIKSKFPVPGGFVPVLCTQCGECATVCPAQAISYQNGAYVIDPDECIKCGACVENCPSGAIHMHADAEAPIKCDLCLECLKVCNTGALVPVEAPCQRKDLPAWTDSEERLYA